MSLPNREAIEMMSRCVSDIESLREQVKTLLPRAEAFDALKAVLRLVGGANSYATTDDVLWTLKKRIRELNEEDKKKGEAS